MLTIRPEQFEALAQASFPRILDGWTEELGQAYPEQTSQFSNAQLRELLGRKAEAAAGYGLSELTHVREYMELLLRFGSTPEGAPTEPWMLEILEDPEATEHQKMDRIAAVLDEMEPTDEADEDAELEDAEVAAEEVGADGEEPEIAVDPSFDVPPDPEEMDLELPDDEDDLAW